MMTKTGITRYIDDLGRVVIPKEIRRSLCIREGDSLDVYVDGDKVVFAKHSYLNSILREIELVADAISNVLHLSVAICDNDKILAVSGLNEKLYMHECVDSSVMYQQKLFDSLECEHPLKPVLCSDLHARFVQPIIRGSMSSGNTVGAIIVFEPYNFIPEAEEFSSEVAKTLLDSYAKYLTKLIEEISAP